MPSQVKPHRPVNVHPLSQSHYSTATAGMCGIEAVVHLANVKSYGYAFVKNDVSGHVMLVGSAVPDATVFRRTANSVWQKRGTRSLIQFCDGGWFCFKHEVCTISPKNQASPTLSKSSGQGSFP